MGTGAMQQNLLKAVTTPPPATIDQVIAAMQTIDSLLPDNDGLKWFNLLYLMVTKEVQANHDTSTFANPAWLSRLDVVFAGFYFTAIADFLNQSSSTPSSWNALFEARSRADVDRIQFALAGMNAHINHDLALALLQVNQEMNITPSHDSPEHNDYEKVNDLLETVLPKALEFLATGILGQIAQDTGKIGRLLAIWNVRVARDLAWDFSDHLRHLNGILREIALDSQDKLTGAIGRALLLPISV